MHWINFIEFWVNIHDVIVLQMNQFANSSIFFANYAKYITNVSDNEI